MPNADKEMRAMLTDDEIGEQLRERGLEEEYVRELMVSLGFDPAEGFTNEGIEALDNATMDVRRKAALRTLALAPDDGDEADGESDDGSDDESQPADESEGESDGESRPGDESDGGSQSHVESDRDHSDD